MAAFFKFFIFVRFFVELMGVRGDPGGGGSPGERLFFWGSRVFITVHDRSYAFVPVRERSWIDEPLWTGSDAKTIPTVSRWHSIPHSYTSSAAYCDDDARFLRLGTQVPLANHKYSLFVISATKKAKGLLGSSEST